jgi:hypothetical protein
MKQVEAETQAWDAARTKFLSALSGALTTGNFAEVPLDPLISMYQGAEGAPVTAEMEQKLVQGYMDQTLKSDDQISIQQQVSILESARRTRLTERFNRKLALTHLQHEAYEYKRTKTVMNQELVGIRKASG